MDKEIGNYPENTDYDRKRFDQMRLKPIRYGFFRVTKEAVPPRFCARCLNEINGEYAVIGNLIYHYKCYGNAPDK